MPASCIVERCANKGGKEISLHRFPKDDKIRKIWIRLVNNTNVRSDFVWSERSVVCVTHSRGISFTFTNQSL